MSHRFKYDKSLSIEDEVLDAIRSRVEPDTILALLDTVLAEKYTSRKESKELKTPPFFKRIRGFIYGNKKHLPDVTEKTLRSARYLLKTKKSWSAKTKLIYIKEKISFVLDRYPSRGFLSSLWRALDFYFNPSKSTMWEKLKKSEKSDDGITNSSKAATSGKLNHSMSREYLDDDDNNLEDDPEDDQYNSENYNPAAPPAKYDEINDQDNDDNDDENNIDFHRRKKYNQKRYKKIKKSNKEKKFEVQDEETDDNNDVSQPVDYIKRHKRIRVSSKSDEHLTYEQQNDLENDTISKNVETKKKEQAKPNTDSEQNLSSSDDHKLDDQNTTAVGSDKNLDNKSSDNKTSNTTITADKLKDNKSPDQKHPENQK